MHEVIPHVELVQTFGSRYEPLFKIYTAYRRCYSDQDSWLVTNNRSVPFEEMEAFVRKMLRAEHAHESPLEMASLAFHITCDRACSHQFVRHRIASYAQQSQRYVKVTDVPYILPPLSYLSNENRKLAHEDYLKDIAHAEAAYARKIEQGVKPEDARGVLPNMVATQFMVSMNFRTLRHFFAERLCNRAQWQIRGIAAQMLRICQSICPAVFEHAGPHCIKLKHCPEPKPCGKRPWEVS